MNLLLQPQRSLEELRYWLCTVRNWQIIDEKIVHDRGHFYVIMNVRTRHNNASISGEICCPALNLIECWLGPILIRKYANFEVCDASARDLWISYLEDREKTLNKAVRGNADLSQVLIQVETILHDAREFRKRGDA
jgi:tRNA A22 N-methylase